MRETSPSVLLMAKPPARPQAQLLSSPVIKKSRVARKAGVSTRSVVHGPRSAGTARSRGVQSPCVLLMAKPGRCGCER